MNEQQGKVGVNCLPIGAPGAANQRALQGELGVRQVLGIGTAGLAFTEGTTWTMDVSIHETAEVSPSRCVWTDRAP